MKSIKVAIDGPAGSGKSSICKIVAKKLGFVHIDTGAMFRAITLYALNNGIDLYDESAYQFVNNIKVIYKENKTFLNDMDVSSLIRTDEVTKNVSQVSKIKLVRDKMIEFERESAAYGNVLMDGRDIGTVVLPDADVKIFLTASIEERANRRYKELIAKGEEVSYEDILADIKARDLKDSTREIAPLRKAEDAILLDTTSLNIDQVCDKIIKIVNNKVGIVMNDEKVITSMEDIDLDFKKYRRGQVVTGTVVEVSDKEVLLNLNAFTEGVIYKEHFTLDKDADLKSLVKVGDELQVEIKDVTEGDYTGAILCSRLNLLKNEKFAEIVNLVNTENVISVKVNKQTDKGFTVSYAGFNLFMPKSQTAHGVKVNDVVEARVISADEKRKTAIVSSRIVAELKREAEINAELASINEGDVLNATVVKVLPFACYVKFNHVQAMLRLSELSHEFIKDINDVIKVGDQFEVKVLTKKNDKLTVSRKALLKTPFELFAEAHKVGETVKGTVVNKLEFGLLVEVAPHIRGLLHKSEFSWNPNDNFDRCVVLGDEVEVAIKEIDEKNNRIALSRKALIDNPWARVKARSGDIVSCTVTEVTDEALKVSALGVDGVILATSALTREQNGKLADYFAVGDTFDAIVEFINTREWNLRLNVRRLKERESRKEFEKYMTEDASEVTLGDVLEDYLK